MIASELPMHLRQLRASIRNFLCVASIRQLRAEQRISRDMGDSFRAACIQELIDEHIREDFSV